MDKLSNPLFKVITRLDRVIHIINVHAFIMQAGGPRSVVAEFHNGRDGARSSKPPFSVSLIS